jgi:hypothetical protein
LCGRGEGDKHDPEFSGYGQTIELNSPGLFGDDSACYSLTLYPSEELFQVYSTKNPVVATVGSVCIIVFTSLLFFIYDFFVRQEFHNKKTALKAKRHFVRFVSHEVRTPLHAVSMGLQLLQNEMVKFTCPRSSKDNQTHKPVEDQLQDKLTDWSVLSEDILSNTLSAVDVLNDLLNYDKIEAGTLHLELTVIPIWKLIEDTASEFKLHAKKKNINYLLDFSSLVDPANADSKSVLAKGLFRDVKEREVVGDAMRISQVLRNLISNALKFTPEGGKFHLYLERLVVSCPFSICPLQPRKPYHSDVLAENGRWQDYTYVPIHFEQWRRSGFSAEWRAASRCDRHRSRYVRKSVGKDVWRRCAVQRE